MDYWQREDSSPIDRFGSTDLAALEEWLAVRARAATDPILSLLMVDQIGRAHV